MKCIVKVHLKLVHPSLHCKKNVFEHLQISSNRKIVEKYTYFIGFPAIDNLARFLKSWNKLDGNESNLFSANVKFCSSIMDLNVFGWRLVIFDQARLRLCTNLETPLNARSWILAPRLFPWRSKSMVLTLRKAFSGMCFNPTYMSTNDSRTSSVSINFGKLLPVTCKTVITMTELFSFEFRTC